MESADVPLIRDIAIIVFAVVGTSLAIVAVALFWSLNRRLGPILVSMQTITSNGVRASQVIADEIVAPLAQGVGVIALIKEVITGLQGLSKKEDQDEQRE